MSAPQIAKKTSKDSIKVYNHEEELHIKVTSSQFRKHQKALFELARHGVQVRILQGGETFRLVPDDGEYVIASPALLQRIEEAKAHIEAGRSLKFNSPEEIHEWFNNRKKRV